MKNNKNMFVLPTDKPSKFWFNLKGKLVVDTVNCLYEDIQCQNIYITNDEEIKDGERGISINNSIYTHYDYLGKTYGKKIILTTDQDLIKDGVQAIDDEFLEWFVKNPSCEEVNVVGDDCYYEIIIPSIGINSLNNKTNMRFKVRFYQDDTYEVLEKIREAYIRLHEGGYM